MARVKALSRERGRNSGVKGLFPAISVPVNTKIFITMVRHRRYGNMPLLPKDEGFNSTFEWLVRGPCQNGSGHEARLLLVASFHTIIVIGKLLQF
jgi:hypothetical protein